MIKLHYVSSRNSKGMAADCTELYWGLNLNQVALVSTNIFHADKTNGGQENLSLIHISEPTRPY